ncbi:MAG TPA: DHHA1 domain-containing protein, partial [Tepidisphaeraceae bacterium]|nr:DHHA1 domain-containing protein [Tepidisphaeraceae bacterium]
MHRPKRWNMPEPDSAAATELAARLRTSPLVAQMLLNRGVREPAECQDFLRPSLKCLHDPAGIPGLTRAAERIARAIRDNERIVIYGDYDVDGTTATAILWHAVRVLGGTATFYIPHRIVEGYGLNPEAMAQICADGAQLIITVDCGVTAIEPAQIARERGVDLIVTDHHEWRNTADCGLRIAESGAASNPSSNPESEIRNPQSPLLPDCHTVVHPRLPRPDGSAPYANPHLCGAGVAYKLAWGVGMAMSGATRVSEGFREFLLDATALAALGTIADVVPLVGENRVLAHYGLGGLTKTRLTGIRALIESAGLTGQALDSYDVGFKLAPRLNACGRMGHARLVVEMLTSANAAKAQEIATYLEGQNRARQAIERKILEQAEAMIAEHHLADDGSCALVLGREEWHPGVIGIVASRLVDRYHRPSVMVALSNGHGQGSARSIPGFHLARALDACTAHLESHGGHEMAAGLKLATDKFPDFQAAFCEHAKQTLSPDQLVPELRLDTLAELREITHALVADLKRLGPFGQGNRRPILCCRGVTVAAPPRRCGRGNEHLQLVVRQGQVTLKCIAFGYGPLDAQLTPGTTIDLAIEATVNEFNGRSNVELEVRDIAFSAACRRRRPAVPAAVRGGAAARATGTGRRGVNQAGATETRR